MRCYLVRRVVAVAMPLVFVSVLVFVVVRVLPGDPAALIMGTEGNREAADRLQQSMGLDRPWAVQHGEWLAGALRGDLGVSIQYDVPVGRLIGSRLPVTLPLAGMAAALMTATAIPFGVYAATRHRRVGDYATMIVSQLGITVPAFRLGLLLILLFSVHLGWIESGGFAGWSDGWWPRIRSLLLPAAALGLFQAAGPHPRDALGRPGRAPRRLRPHRARKGRRGGRVIWRHALRNAMIPIVTVAGLQLGQLLAGAIVLESVFALPGLGRLALGAITARDLPVVQGVTVFVASCIVLVNFVVDVTYLALDPRIRYE